MKRVHLSAVCVQARETVKPNGRPELRYIGLETIQSGTGALIDGALSKTPETPRANSFRFNSKHVLYGKLRPYLNKVVLPDFEGKCSTEIIPLKPSDELDRAYLAYFLRCKQTVGLISARTAGARMPRADMAFVLNLEIPLPPRAEQRRVVDLLSRAEGIVQLRRAAATKAAELIPAIFHDVFGYPRTNPKGWPVLPLGDLVISGPQNGLYKHKSRYGSGTPILRIDAFYDGVVGKLEHLKRVQLDAEEIGCFQIREDDIVINRVNSPEYLGKSALIPPLLEPTVFESNMMRFSVDHDRIKPSFLIALLQSPAARAHFLARAKHAINQSSINQEDVKSLPVITPPVDLQARFHMVCDSIASISAQHSAALQKASSIFEAMLSRAFFR